MYAIEYYRRENGISPVEDFLEELRKSGNVLLIRTIAKYIDELKKHGKQMNMEFSPNSYEQLEPNLMEIKPGKVRVLMTFVEGKFYLLHAFYKKSNKTPEHEKSVARGRMKQILAKK
jgi:phage-related protein